LPRTIINESISFPASWIRSGFLAYSLFVVLSLVTLVDVTRTEPAILDTAALWTFLFGPILAGFAALDARRINTTTDLYFDVQIINSWDWAGEVLAFSPVTFWVYVSQRRRVPADYPVLIQRAETEKQREEYGYSEKVSSVWYPVALFTYFAGFYVSLFYLLSGSSSLYAFLPWYFIYGPLIALFILFDAWKINSSSKDRHLNQRFWPLFAWLFLYAGFWFYFIERRRVLGGYKESDRGDRSKAAGWSTRFYDISKVKLHRVVFRVKQAAGVRSSARSDSSKQRSSTPPKKPTLDSQIQWALGIFGLDSQASKVLVRKKYREMISEYHPDRLGQATDAQRRLVEDKTKEINRAHDILERYFVGGTKNEEPSVLDQIIRAIESFVPSTVWNNEEGYHAELFSVLKQSFPEVSVDPQKDSSRPDLLIQEIGIEIRGPTDAAELKSLPDECLRYSPHYQNLIFVLFKPEFTELLYKEITDGITRTYPNVRIVRKA